MKKSLIALALSAAVTAGVAEACTGISLSTTTNDHIQARTIEWGEDDLNSKLVVVPRNFAFTSIMPDRQNGMSWKSKYGFVGISAKVDRFIADGVNEHGLTAGLFYFKKYGSLAPFDPKAVSNNIVDMDFVRWVLSMHKTVDEVKTALQDIKVVPVYIDPEGVPTPTAHWRVADKAGNVIVIEIVENGKVNIYDDKVGVLTNAPDYPWQVTNLNNYINLMPGTTAPKMVGNHKVESFGTGTGFLGLPGDISPPSRFVRAAFYVNTAPELKTPERAVAEAFHILNNFDLPIGSEFNPEYRAHIPDIPSATQWTTAVDQTNGMFYYKTMHDSTIKRVSLKSLNFRAKKEVVKDLDKGHFHFENVTVR